MRLVAACIALKFCLIAQGQTRIVDATLPTPCPANRYWVFFQDKGYVAGSRAEADALRELATTYPQRAIHRRALRRSDPGMFDARDLALSADYLAAIQSVGASAHVTSRWLNAVSVQATPAQLDLIRSLPFVRRVEPVRRGRSVAADVTPTIHAWMADGPAARSIYGYAEAQTLQMNLAALHTQGYTGDGVIIGVLDTGFLRAHEAFNNPAKPLSVVAEHDFVSNDANTSAESGDDPGQHVHGTLILGTLAAYLPDTFVGTAVDASFVLCKTEDITSETPIEEDNYVAGLEFIEFHGGDVTTSSLGYIDWYTQHDLDGQTAVTTIAVNIASANGVHCCTAAGNSGNDADPATSHLIAPADAQRVITCGAVDVSGTSAWFTSDGPTADGRVKPELLARGIETVSVAADGSNGYWAASGTSLSTPLVAGAVACLTQARPNWSVDQMRSFLTSTADLFASGGAPDPLFIRGYGIVNAAAALARDCNANGIDDSTDISSGLSRDCNHSGVADECECRGELDGDCEIGLSDLAQVLSHFGETQIVQYADGDLDFDDDVDLADLALLLANFGVACPQ